MLITSESQKRAVDVGPNPRFGSSLAPRPLYITANQSIGLDSKFHQIQHRILTRHRTNSRLDMYLGYKV